MRVPHSLVVPRNKIRVAEGEGPESLRSRWARKLKHFARCVDRGRKNSPYAPSGDIRNSPEVIAARRLWQLNNDELTIAIVCTIEIKDGVCR